MVGWPCNSAGGGRFIFGPLERKSYLEVAFSFSRGGFLSSGKGPTNTASQSSRTSECPQPCPFGQNQSKDNGWHSSLLVVLPVQQIVLAGMECSMTISRGTQNVPRWSLKRALARQFGAYSHQNGHRFLLQYGH